MTLRTMYMLAIAMLLGLPAFASQGDTYLTLNDAATAALTEAEQLTDSYEAGGSLYQCQSGFIYVRPETDHSRNSLSVRVYAIENCTLAGLYHTHPKGDARYSQTDVIGACSLKTVSFIKPRNGTVRAFDCTGLSAIAVKVAVSGDRPITGKPI